MNTTLFLSLLVIMGLSYVLVGRITSANMQGSDDYYLGERKFGITALALTFLATQLGGGMLLGAADVAFYQGWVALLYPLGICSGLLILALGVGAKLRNLNINTMPELFEKKYKSIQLRRFASIVSIISLFFLLVGQAIATRQFYVALGFDQYWILFITWAVLMFYTVSGGLRAVIYTDIMQVAFVIFSFLFIYVLVQNSTNVQDFNFSGTFFSAATTVDWLAWLLMPMLFMLIGQDMGQRCFAARSTKTISIATALGALLLILCALFPIYFGLYAKETGILIPEGASVLMTTIEFVSTPMLTAVFATAFLLIIISTADSLLCSISSNLAYDFSFIHKNGENHNLHAAKLITFIVGASAVIISLFFDNILELFVHSYAFSVGVIFVPFIMALLLKQAKYTAALFAMTVGATSYVIFSVITPPITKEIFVLLLSLLSFTIGQLYANRSQ